MLELMILRCLELVSANSFYYDQITNVKASFAALAGCLSIFIIAPSVAMIVIVKKNLPALNTADIGTLVVIGQAICIWKKGAKNFDNCPAQDLIPIFLTVYGSMGLVLLPMTCVLWFLFLCTQEGNHLGSCLICVTSVLLCLHPVFTFIWFICGNVWVFSIYQPSYEITSGTYCDEITYKFSVVLIISTWLSPFLSCFCNFCSSCCSTKSESYEE